MKRWMTMGSVALFAASVMVLPGCAEEDTSLPPAENIPDTPDAPSEPVTPAPDATGTGTGNATDGEAPATTRPSDGGGM